MTVSRIRLSRPHFDDLAAGGGDAGSALWTGQLSKRMLLLHVVVETAAAQAPEAHRDSHLEVSLALLSRARRKNRQAADEIIMQPRVGSWAERCLRQLVGTMPSAANYPDLGELGALAAAAAYAAGVDFDLPLAAAGSSVTFPGFGVADVPAESAALWARGRAGVSTIEVSDGRAAVLVPLHSRLDEPGWRPLRRMTEESAGLRLTVTVDDVDPLRDPQGLGALDRLTPGDLAVWRARLADAWRLLVAHHRPTATAIADRVDSLVPLRSTVQAPDMSATLADSFGAISLTLPRDPLAFASALVHEFQHTKLSALLDLVSLHHHADGGLFYAPWRADARPLRGLFQGTYAYLGLAEFMNVERKVSDPVHRRFAEFEFARFREQVWRASGDIAGSGVLTRLGQDFVATMRRRVQELRHEKIDPSTQAAAASADEYHQTTWQLANVRCDDDQVNHQARRFLAGKRCTIASDNVKREVVQASTTFRSNMRLKLAHLALTDPPTFQALVANPTRARPSQLADVIPADLQLSTDRPAEAARGYQLAVVADPDHLGWWTGLSVARRAGSGQLDDPLATQPELVLQLHREVRRLADYTPDPVELSGWLANGDRLN